MVALFDYDKHAHVFYALQDGTPASQASLIKIAFCFAAALSLSLLSISIGRDASFSSTAASCCT